MFALLHLGAAPNVAIIIIVILLVYLLLWLRVKTLKVAPLGLTVTFK
jgi:hypothetical protein